MLRYWAVSIGTAFIAAVLWSLGSLLAVGSVYILRESDRDLISSIAGRSVSRYNTVAFIYTFAVVWIVSVSCFGGIALLRLPARLSKLNDANLHLCLRCWYDTDQIKATKCPECGYPINPKQQELQWFHHYGPLLWLNRKMRRSRSGRS
jgi:ribosomal protein L37E